LIDRMANSDLIERIEKMEHEVELLKKDLTKKTGQNERGT